jgi:hypothetical protein
MLHKQTVEGLPQLLEIRDDIAHRGNVASLEDAKRLAAAARRDATWLDDQS